MKIYKILILLFLYKINISYGVIKTTDSIVAFINHHIILDSDVRKNLNIIQYNISEINQYLSKTTPSYQEMLNQQITKTLIFNIAEQDNIHVEKNQITTIIKNILYLNNLTLNQFQTYLNHIGINYKQYYSQLYQEIANKIICKRVVHQRAHISPDEINELIQILNTIDYNKQFKIVHIILPLPIQTTQNQLKIAEKLAKYLIKNYKTNDNITTLINTDNSKNHIFQPIKIQQTEWISWKNIPIIFDQYLQTTKIGDIIGPIRSYDGIHILKIKDIRCKEFIFPITKVKIKIIALKKTFNQNNAIENLLKIKKNVENGNITFNIIIKNKPKNYCYIHHNKYLQWNDLDDLESEIKKSLINLKKNEISVPINTSFGWCLIQLIDINNLNYSEMIRERANYYLLSQKFNPIINNWIKELQTMSYIKVINQNE